MRRKNGRERGGTMDEALIQLVKEVVNDYYKTRGIIQKEAPNVLGSYDSMLVSMDALDQWLFDHGYSPEEREGASE